MQVSTTHNPNQRRIFARHKELTTEIKELVKMLRATVIGGQSALDASSAQLLHPRLVEHHGREDKETVSEGTRVEAIIVCFIQVKETTLMTSLHYSFLNKTFL